MYYYNLVYIKSNNDVITTHPLNNTLLLIEFQLIIHLVSEIIKMSLFILNYIKKNKIKLKKIVIIIK